MATLGAADKTRIAMASRPGCELRARDVARYSVRHGRWLGLNNSYQADPVRTIKDEVTANIPHNNKHLGEYIAASALVHCWEGWTYLGRALQAHSNGLPDIARHLGYYAELRGAMSLLAAEGIGIFDRHHFVLDSNGAAHLMAGNTTHQATWLYLEEWASNQGANLLGRTISLESADVESWISAMPGQPTWQAIGTDWLKRLGLDLKRLADDRDARNLASYRPRILHHAAPTAVDAAQLLTDIVRNLEPQAPVGFATLDLHFVRRTFEIAFRSITNSSPRQAPRRYRDAVDGACQQMVAGEARRTAVRNFLLRAEQPMDAAILRLAERQDGPDTSLHHLEVASRAAILLRLATGSAAQMLRSAGLDMDTIAWWWQREGTTHALWTTAPDAEDVTDIWLDFDDHLLDLEEWVLAAGEMETYRDLSDDCAPALARVTTLEGLALLGIAS